jgi:hypothetical protein
MADVAYITPASGLGEGVVWTSVDDDESVPVSSPHRIVAELSAGSTLDDIRVAPRFFRFSHWTRRQPDQTTMYFVSWRTLNLPAIPSESAVPPADKASEYVPPITGSRRTRPSHGRVYRRGGLGPLNDEQWPS